MSSPNLVTVPEAALNETETRRLWSGHRSVAIYIIATCVALHIISALLATIANDGDLVSFLNYLGQSNAIVRDIGTGGIVSLKQLHLWSLIDSGYLHVGILHLATNAICLIWWMPLVEQNSGKARTFILFTAASVAGSLASAMWAEVSSLGASGGVFGVLGCRLAFGWRHGGQYGRSLMASSAFWTALNLAIGQIEAINVSNAAHIGGLIAGLVFGVTVDYGKTSVITTSVRRGLAICVLLTALSLIVGVGRGVWFTHQAITDRAAYNRHIYAQNILDYSELIRQKPDDAKLYYGRGSAEYLSDNLSAALSDFSNSIRLSPNPDNLLARGLLLFRDGKTDLAIEDFGKVIQQAPWMTDAYLSRAAAYLMKKSFDPALADYAEARRLAPKNFKILYNRSFVHVEAANYKDALSDIDEAIAHGVDGASVRNSRAWVLFKLGRAGEALPDAEKSLALDPRSAPALDTRAHIFEALGQRDKAIADYRSALARDPTLQTTREGLQRMGVEP